MEYSGELVQFFYETGYVPVKDRSVDKSPEEIQKELAIERDKRRLEFKVIDGAIEQFPDIVAYSRMYGVTGSDYCNIDADTVLYEWDFSKFVPLEFYVQMQEDRQVWAQRDSERNRPKQG